MAINAFELCDKNIPPTLINVLKGVNRAPGSVRMIKTNFDDDSANRGSRTKKKKNSPYLNGEKVQLISRMTDKRMVQKKNEMFSSFPLAANIYRASSDEFKALKKSRQKARKSVLTLPNVPAPIPKACTVSDMNDSDYFNNKHEKKFTPPHRYINTNRKIQSRSKGYEFYDRDAQRFEDCRSTDLLHKNGDGKLISSRGKGICRDDDVQDVWSVLRNINKFQFRPTPRISDEDSFCSNRKKKAFTRKFKCRKGRRLIGTCRTEEVAYVADFEIQSKTSASRSSSFDRITVINKSDLQSPTNLDKEIAITQNPRRAPYKPKKLIPLNEKKLCKNAPNSKSTHIKDNNRLVAFIKKQNAHMNKIFNNTVNAAAVNEKRHDSSYSFKDSLDSSNCLRLSDNEASNCTLRPKLTLTHPNEFKEILYNGCSQSSFNFVDKDKSLQINNNTEISSSEKITKGMTQVVFNNNNVNSISNKGPVKPKPRLVTTMPSGATMPKLTAADIKRRLTHIKFPLVVLGKDELSSTMEVFDYDPPHLSGLNKHIWPFMLEWKKKTTAPKKSSPRPVEGVANNLRKVNNDISLARVRDKRIPNNDLFSKKNGDSRRGLQQEMTTPPGQKKAKPMRQFKDKMLKLLYKNNNPGCVKDGQNTEPVKVEPVKVDVSTEMVLSLEDYNNNVISEEVNTVSIIERNKVSSPKRVAFEEHKSIPKKLEEIITTVDKPRNALQALNMKMPGARHPWAKAKWASDFVDNVMRKIKNGSYYGIEEKKALTNYNKVSFADKVIQNENTNNGNVSMDASIQTCEKLAIASKVDFEQNYSEKAQNPIEEDVYDPFLSIPGFDDGLPNLEIKTLNANQIQVKNCLTNVMVQFDVTMPQRSSNSILDDSSSTSSSFIPLSVTNSNTKVYKCSTTILNAVLPAELCTVLPKIMRNLFDSNTTFASTTTLPNLTISELSECESYVKSSLNSSYSPVNHPWWNQYYPAYNAQPTLQNNLWRYSPNNQWMAPMNLWPGSWVPPYGWPEYLPIYISPVLTRLLQGRFGYLLRKRESLKRSRSDIIQQIELKWSEKMIQPKPLAQALIALVVDPVTSVTYHESEVDVTSVDNSIEVIETADCTTLQLFKEEARWIPSIGNFKNLVQTMWNYCKFNVHFTLPNYINSSIITCNNNKFTVDMVVGDSQGMENTMSLTFTHINTFFNSIEDSSRPQGDTKMYKINALKSIECSKDLSNVKDAQQLTKRVKEKVRRSGYVNLYKKCKSLHNYEDRDCMSLSDIVNIEDFTLALGAAKSLCSVIDGCSGQKVLKCVKEMKTWVKEITPGQALLVLLLANKKETPNLVRFRPVLLQGIAVNRITRAMELDMEIEVIERENLQLAERDGISYIPASAANQDSLFDELCWIAKTTASDYQKPFDESSERLLKALLGKRKKLNPSYLRVMARYVGLGLLKTPTKY